MTKTRIESLEAKIAQLEATINSLSSRLKTVATRQVDWDKIDTRYRKLLENDMLDAFERIKNIELRLFPNLAADVLRFHEIVGEGDDKAYNRLDFRETD